MGLKMFLSFAEHRREKNSKEGGGVFFLWRHWSILKESPPDKDLLKVILSIGQAPVQVMESNLAFDPQFARNIMKEIPHLS